MGKKLARPVTKNGRSLNVRADSIDFRDLMFTPTLVEVPSFIDLGNYRNHKVPILDQGKEGACTGFGLASVVNYLLRTRKIVPDETPVSPWMLYQMAKRYDEWAGEDYEGSSARGAMKGWHKHGICGDTLWELGGDLTPLASKDATQRPLGAYYRVNHKDLVAMHSAIAEVGILYATASVHEGWEKVGRNGTITLSDVKLGGHAFAIVAYDGEGFWLQNSWGDKWGKEGFAHISYDDWLANGTDVWVARLGAPVLVATSAAIATRHSAATSYTDALSLNDLRRHIVSIGNDGCLKPEGTYGTGAGDVRNIFEHHIPQVTQGWKKRRILLYAHGGLVDEESSVQRLADYLPALLKEEIYPISFIWHSDFWSTMKNILVDAMGRRRPEGFLDSVKDFMLDRLDDALEPIARPLGKSMWAEMKENAQISTAAKEGGAKIAIDSLAKLIATDKSVEVHLAGHSAGSIFHGPIVEELVSKCGISIESCTLWAPACTMELFKRSYLPAIKNGEVKRFALFTLNDKTEQDDNCAKIYNKSLLYLVSNAFEDEPRIPLFRDGEPILGMEKFIRDDEELVKLFNGKNREWVLAPNNDAEHPAKYSTARHHGDFDDDEATLKATLARILGAKKIEASFRFNRSASSMRNLRINL
jgi:hypothetical protein